MHQGTGGSRNADDTKAQQVVDFEEARAQRLEAKRRKTERIFFKQLLGAYCVSDEAAMRSVELIEVSEDGCSFLVPFDATKPWPNKLEELPVRIYFSQDTYLPILLKIQNSRIYLENGVRYSRFGCTVDRTVSSYIAYQQFVRFLKLYAEHSHKDNGNVSVFYL